MTHSHDLIAVCFCLIVFCLHIDSSYADSTACFIKGDTIVEFSSNPGKEKLHFAMVSNKPASQRPIVDRPVLAVILGQACHGDLQSINFNSAVFSQEAIDDLNVLPPMKSLYFNKCDVTEQVFSKLKGDKLQELSLFNTKITDNSLKIIFSFSKLQALDLGDSSLKGKSLRQFAKLKELRMLSCGRTNFNDESARSLAAAKKLLYLDLRGTKITDEGLKYIAMLHNLEHLNLACTQVSNQGIKLLTKLTNLKTLNLECSNVTQLAYQKLVTQIPGLKITPTVKRLEVYRDPTVLAYEKKRHPAQFSRITNVSLDIIKQFQSLSVQPLHQKEDSSMSFFEEEQMLKEAEARIKAKREIKEKGWERKKVRKEKRTKKGDRSNKVKIGTDNETAP